MGNREVRTCCVCDRRHSKAGGPRVSTVVLAILGAASLASFALAAAAQAFRAL